MNAQNIPLKEEFDKLVASLAELEPLALKLSRDAIHSQSPHIAPLLGRVRGAIESSGWHVKALAALPEPSTPATDAKAGATPAK